MEDFVLTNENYYSEEANRRYMSFHQYLNFAGGMLVEGCEERAMEKLNGNWEEEKTLAFRVGSYVDSYFEGTLDTFKKENPDLFAVSLDYAMPLSEMREEYGFMFTKNGRLKADWTKTKILKEYPHLLKERLTLKAPYQQANRMIERCEKDEYFMKTMSGEKQVIMTGYWAGCEWKIKMDSYIPGRAIVDLKTSADIHKAWRVRDYGYCSFIEAFCYDQQLAIYQKIVEINTGKKLPCYISVVTKSDHPEIAVVNIDQYALDNALNTVAMKMPSVLQVKNGEVEPIRCEHCDYCKATHKITGPINMRDLIIEDF